MKSISIGGGSAGAVVALRLSEDKNVSVLLLEAGTSVPDIFNIPVLGPLKQASNLDWQYKTVPQRKSSIWPSGKVLGGTTHLNYMIYLQGNKNDFLSWKDPNSDEWNTRDVLYYFDKARICSLIHKEEEKKFCSIKGSMPVREASFTTEFSDAVLKAFSEIGFETTNLNTKRRTGFMKPEVNIDMRGKRWTSDQNLRVALKKRRNLKVLTNIIVNKILLKNGYEAYGIQFRRGGKTETIFAREEIILSAGTVGSAKILMLSGIGPKALLSTTQIKPIVDLPVGKNLQDHITTGLDLVLLNRTVFSITDLTSPKTVYEYFVNGKGPFTSNTVEAVGVIHSNLNKPEQGLPDLQFMVMMAGTSSDGGLLSRHILGISDKIWDGYFAQLTNISAVTILPVLLHPLSVGEVEIDPKHPEGQPLINPRYLSKEDDVKALIRGIRFIQKIVKTKALENFGAKFNNKTLPGCEAFVFNSDDYWECYIRHLTLTSYHPVGTCKMGVWSSGDSVVDHRLRVHKTNKLRVIDASIMPSLPSANTNAAVVMIAEKGADLIKEDYHKRRTSSDNQFFLPKKRCDIHVPPASVI